MQRYVFDFSEGDKEQKDMLGGIGRRRCPGAVAVWEGASERFTPFWPSHPKSAIALLNM